MDHQRAEYIAKEMYCGGAGIADERTEWCVCVCVCAGCGLRTVIDRGPTDTCDGDRDGDGG